MMKEERYSRTDEVKQNRSEEAMERRSLEDAARRQRRIFVNESPCWEVTILYCKAPGYFKILVFILAPLLVPLQLGPRALHSRDIQFSLGKNEKKGNTSVVVR